MEQESTTPAASTDAALLDARLEAFAMCMICSGEYPPERNDCPNCSVALSLVRRCYSCSRVVSAKHRRCIHCGLAFFPDGEQEEFSQQDALDRIAAFRKQREAAKKRNTMRALSVSVATFLSVLFIALLITRQFTDGAPNTVVIATSYLLRPAELRRAASESSANVATLAAGGVIEIVSYAIGDRERAWVAVRRNDDLAYIRTDAIAPPKAREAVRGFEVLKFYIAAIDDASVIPEAAKAVAYFNQAFPDASISGQELRWVLAEKARLLAARGKSREQLLAEARAQYQMLIDANGEFAHKARIAMNAPLANGERMDRSAQTRVNRESSLSVIGADGSPVTQTVTGFARNPAHEVTLLEHANIAVRLSRPGAVKDAGTIRCSVVREVQSNGTIVIPEGSPCRVRLVALQDKTATITLAGVDVRSHSYGLSTSVASIRNNSGLQTASDKIIFRLQAPVAFTK